MSNDLSEMDRELLGEVSYNNGGEATMAEVTGGSGNGAFEGSSGATFTPLNATAGTLIKVSSNGDELKPGSETVTGDINAVPKTPKKRGAATAVNDESPQPAKKRSPTKKATSTTNGAGADSATTAKKRASPKGKGIAYVNASTGDGETDGETEGLEPVTPKKGKRAVPKAKVAKAENDVNAHDGPAGSTDKSASSAKGNGAVDGMTAHNTPRKRQPPKKEVITPRGIPSSWDEAGEADRMLVTMKEKGEGWSEIRAAWKAVTGQDTASSTLPNRYNRLKVNMMHMKEGDEKHLLAAKKEVEATFWSTVTANMERRGADKYPVAFVQKTYKELEAAGKADLDAVDDAESSGSTTTSNNKDTDGGNLAEGSETTGGDKLAEGSKTSVGAKKTTRVKKNAGAKELIEANEDVVVKEEETETGDDA